MGGVHFTQPRYSEHVQKTGKGYLQATLGAQTISITRVIVSSYAKKLFRREEEFRSYLNASEILCVKGAISSDNVFYKAALYGNADINTKMAMLSMAADKQKLSYGECVAIADLIGRIANGEIPPSDEEYYAKACQLAESDQSGKLKQAQELFEKINDYQDSALQAEEVKKKYDETLQAEKEQAVLERERQKKKTRKTLAIGIPAAVICIAVIIVLATVVIPNNNYKKAKAFLDAGEYGEAIAAFEALGGYKDSAEQINVAKDAKAKTDRLAEEAQNEAERLAEEARIEAENAAAYEKAKALFAAGDYDGAIAAFRRLGDYRDSQTQADEAELEKAKKLISDGHYAEAYKLLLLLGDYSAAYDYLRGYCFLPETITCLQSSSKKTHVFTYDANGKMKKAVYCLDGKELSIGEFDDGVLIQTQYGSAYPDKAGTLFRSYSYNPDYTVFEYSADGKKHGLYDEFGNRVEIYSSRGSVSYERPTDEYHNRTDYATNTYENDRLVSVFYSLNALRIATSVEYKMMYLPGQETDMDLIWRNIRLFCGENIWSV